MAKHEVVTTEADLDRALERASSLTETKVLHATYKPDLDALILNLSDGRRQLIPREDMEGLTDAPGSLVADIEIVVGGTGLHWPALNVSHYVPTLLRHIYGTKRWMAELQSKNDRQSEQASLQIGV